MSFEKDFKDTIYKINDETFEDSSLEVFNYQYSNCSIYQEYCSHLKKTPGNVRKLSDIPFLPIEFFKNHAIKSGDWNHTKVFKSSGTTDSIRSSHFIKNLDFYHQLATQTFESHFGPLEKLEIIAVLPSYLEQGDSSLISMVDHFIQHSSSNSGYFAPQEIGEILKSKEKKMVIGVSYALLDAAPEELQTNSTIIIETGGMKGRKKEITREELHSHLKRGFQVSEIWSEYGMTELLSQAYGLHGFFKFPPWARTFVRDINDPFRLLNEKRTGGINVIDLGNIDSCSFIETKDLGRGENEKFEILGRFDNSDIRGCNLMI